MKTNGNGNRYSDLSLQQYTNLYPSFYDGRTGEAIAKYGGLAGCSLGTYLLANRYANPIGLYYLPLAAIRLPATMPEIVHAFTALDRAAFADYDYATGFVWVREMARIRLGLISRNECLKPGDNRIACANRWYGTIFDNPFLAPFYRRYGKCLRLAVPRKSTLIRKKLPLSPMKGLPKPLPKPLPMPVDQ